MPYSVRRKAYVAVAAVGLAGIATVAVRSLSDQGAAGTIDAGHRAAVESRIASAPKSQFQERILADGQVTFGEYQSAMEAYVACARVAGATPVRGPALTSAQVYDIGFFLGTNTGRAGESLDDRWAKVQACSREHWDLVHQKWSVEHLPTQDRVLAAVTDVTACMRARGVDAPVDPPKGWSGRFWGAEDSFSEAEAVAYRECAMQVFEALGFPKGSIPAP